MKKSKKFFKLLQKGNGKVFWNRVIFEQLRENRNSIKDVDYDITPDIQAHITNTKLTTKLLDNVEKETVFDIFKKLGFNDNIPQIGFNSAGMEEVLCILPKVKDII